MLCSGCTHQAHMGMLTAKRQQYTWLSQRPARHSDTHNEPWMDTYSTPQATETRDNALHSAKSHDRHHWRLVSFAVVAPLPLLGGSRTDDAPFCRALDSMERCDFVHRGELIAVCVLHAGKARESSCDTCMCWHCRWHSMRQHKLLRLMVGRWPGCSRLHCVRVLAVCPFCHLPLGLREQQKLVQHQKAQRFGFAAGASPSMSVPS